MEEIREIAAEAGCELSDEELQGAADGGKICPSDRSCSIFTIESGPPIV